MYIKAYWEYMAYSDIFRPADIFSLFQGRYSGITQEQFMHILDLIQADSGTFKNTGLFRHVMFHAYSAIFSTLE